MVDRYQHYYAGKCAAVQPFVLHPVYVGLVEGLLHGMMMHPMVRYHMVVSSCWSSADPLLSTEAERQASRAVRERSE